MKTPLISNTFTMTLKTFQSAPTSIQNQYSERDIINMIPFVEKYCDDPLWVVQEIIQVLTDKYPQFNYYVGNGSIALR